jgi:hypothetical protein
MSNDRERGMTNARRTNAAMDEEPDAADLVKAIVEQVGPARIIEFCYWSREPGVLGIMRAVAMMSEEARASLEVFLAMSHEPVAIAASWDGSGRLTLTSPQAGQTIALIRYCADHDDGKKPLLPN